jgi:two-component system sensor kinase FixL
MLERQISIEVALGSQLGLVYGDRVQLQQVVLNLLMNAADAVSGAEAADRRIRVATEAIDSRVVVSVTDQGAPMSDAAFDRMFEPFFTTKPDGMGLGLSISRTILETHGGEIAARRNEDRGITCWFAIDSVDAELGTPSPDLDAAFADARGT